MKHPILSSSIRLIIWWIIWLILTTGQVFLYRTIYGSYTKSAIPDSIISLIVFSGICLSMWYPFKAIISSGSRPTSIISNLILSGAVTIILWLLVVRYLTPVFLPAVNDYQAYWDSTFPYRVGVGIAVFVINTMAFYLFVSLFTLSEKKAKEARLETLVKETELKMLRSQINPHFLFNSLNSVSSLTITDPDRAREMVIKLSEFMRYALSKKDEQPVTLRSELENLRLYLEIEKVRFGDRLSTEENIDEYCLDIKMPVMLLQPLYENAVKHGVYESTESVSIKTNVACRSGYTEISISNNYDTAPSSVKGTGTGLINVSRRLDLFYGSKASIKTSKENGIYSVTLFIPGETSNPEK